MKQFNWFKKEIDQKLTDLKTFESTEKISTAIDACEDLIFDEFEFKRIRIDENADISSEFFKEYLEFYNLRFLWKYLVNFYFKSDIDDIDLGNKTQLFSQADSMELVHHFFKHGTSTKFYDDFLKLYKEKKNIDFVYGFPKGFCAESFFLPYYDNFYIQAAPTYTFEDTITLCHEFGHGIQLLNNYQPKLFGKNYVFIELISSVFELLAFNYYNKNAEFRDSSITYLYKSYLGKLSYNDNITCFIGYIKELDLESSQSKKEVVEKINEFISPEELTIYKHIMQERKISEDIPYVIGYLVAIEILNIYYHDPEKAFDIIQKIINIDATLSPCKYFKEILSLGIFPIQSVPLFEDSLKRELKLY